jgi:RNA polymerase-binding transcription factor DksA
MIYCCECGKVIENEHDLRAYNIANMCVVCLMSLWIFRKSRESECEEVS